MAAHVSPGVYTKIIDLSEYVAKVPATIGFLPVLCKKGPDNKLTFVGSPSEYISKFGEPNILEFGSAYSQAPYFAYNFLNVSGALYTMRCLPDDATYANLFLWVTDDHADGQVEIQKKANQNSLEELETSLVGDTTSFGLLCFYPIGRGDYYNDISIVISEHANPMYYGVYILDIYEKQSDGDEVIIESFEFSLDPEALDASGASLYIEDVLKTYSSVLRCKVSDVGYANSLKVLDFNRGKVTVNTTSGSATITDNRQDFTDWDSASGSLAAYYITAIDGRGNKLKGWLGPIDTDEHTITVWDSRDMSTATQAWIGSISDFDVNSDISYKIIKLPIDITGVFSSTDPEALGKGSDGSLYINGQFNPTVATQILADAYVGLIDDRILDTDDIYFNIVWDGAYPKDVKDQAVRLASELRRDCIAIVDNGDNPTFNDAITSRKTLYTYNTKYAAIYEGYNKVYDVFTGRDVWFSPLYHMSTIIPLNDTVSEVWYAPAGFNRAAIQNIKELRYNPRLTQRDQLYLKQLNPIVKFSNGYTVWGQLTSQTKPSALQDLNIMRLILYCQRAIEKFCQYFIFELNDQVTWNQVAGNITLFLEDIKNRRGLYSYNVEVGATEYEIKTKTFHVNVILNPTRVVEHIELNFLIK